MRLVIIGPSGSGKGTQAALLAKDFEISNLSMGEIFRKEYQRGTVAGRKAYNWWSKGKWVPDALTFDVLKPYLNKASKGFILDAFPRTLNQCFILDHYLSSNGQKLDRVILLYISDKEAIKRLFLRAQKDIEKTGKARADEAENIIRERLKSYHKTAEPILAYYQKKGVLERVDGERSIEEIYKEILKKIKNDSN